MYQAYVIMCVYYIKMIIDGIAIEKTVTETQ